jgi:hypothetical protein
MVNIFRFGVDLAPTRSIYRWRRARESDQCDICHSIPVTICTGF